MIYGKQRGKNMGVCGFLHSKILCPWIAVLLWAGESFLKTQEHVKQVAARGNAQAYGRGDKGGSAARTGRGPNQHSQDSESSHCSVAIYLHFAWEQQHSGQEPGRKCVEYLALGNGAINSYSWQCCKESKLSRLPHALLTRDGISWVFQLSTCFKVYWIMASARI